MTANHWPLVPLKLHHLALDREQVSMKDDKLLLSPFLPLATRYTFSTSFSVELIKAAGQSLKSNDVRAHRSLATSMRMRATMPGH